SGCGWYAQSRIAGELSGLSQGGKRASPPYLGGLRRRLEDVCRIPGGPESGPGDGGSRECIGFPGAFEDTWDRFAVSGAEAELPSRILQVAAAGSENSSRS